MTRSLFLLGALCGWAAADVVILPLGDSITQAEYRDGDPSRQFTGYLGPLQTSLTDAGVSFDLVGSQSGRCGDAAPSSFYPANFDFHHEGHWGWRADEILNGADSSHCAGDDGSGNLQTWLDSYVELPDIVLLHIGTNDIIQDLVANTASTPIDMSVNQLTATQIAQTKADVQGIVDKLKSEILPIKPSMKILLAGLISGTYIDPEVKAVNAEFESIAAMDSTVIYVDQNTGSGLTYDHVHPNRSGEDQMANRWYTALRSADVIEVTAVPEPSALCFLLVVTGGIAGVRRLRQIEG